VLAYVACIELCPHDNLRKMLGLKNNDWMFYRRKVHLMLAYNWFIYYAHSLNPLILVRQTDLA
jgi:hypothetical protein